MKNCSFYLIWERKREISKYRRIGRLEQVSMWYSLEKWLFDTNRPRIGGAEVLVISTCGEWLLQVALCNHPTETLRKTSSWEWRNCDSKLRLKKSILQGGAFIFAKAERIGGGHSPFSRESNSRNTILQDYLQGQQGICQWSK